MRYRLVVVPPLPAIPINIGIDPADPPLSEGSRLEAIRTTRKIAVVVGHPSVIWTSPKLLTRQMAEAVVQTFASVKIVEEENLGIPSHEDLDFNAPNADAHGMVTYGPVTTPQDWYNWATEALEAISDAASDGQTIWVMTHPEIAAAILHIAINGYEKPDTLNNLDRTLGPYRLYEDSDDLDHLIPVAKPKKKRDELVEA